ncbi:hypothetical protein DM860_015253 [Cuscuta australis]|uniref:Uncharacterized protein n=1 Tax=Cuscuta australis TaxID=267555 RepID=A0A328CZJ4_9ASTE|nr:hypothetical protein DM860_015253 [Cuscuta australis]
MAHPLLCYKAAAAALTLSLPPPLRRKRALLFSRCFPPFSRLSRTPSATPDHHGLALVFSKTTNPSNNFSSCIAKRSIIFAGWDKKKITTSIPSLSIFLEPIAVCIICVQGACPMPFFGWESFGPSPAEAVLYSPDAKLPRTGELALRRAIPANTSMKAIQVCHYLH